MAMLRAAYALHAGCQPGRGTPSGIGAGKGPTRGWGIENGLHWVLDIAFREDESRVRQGHADKNLAVLRRLALNLLRREPTAKMDTKAKRLKAGWDLAYLLKNLAG
jgi:hypothetical protein